jgi:hypothetical protein
MDLDRNYEERIAAAPNLPSLAHILQELLERCSIWTDGRLLYIKVRVDHVHGLRIDIFPTEHPPPHFHVKAADLDVTFAIEDCRLLHGRIGSRELALIQWWYARSREKLVAVWNATRPSDCPVGPIR